MADDEQAIRALVATWLEASQAGDTARVLSLMSDDAVFLVPGRPPMRKADFAAAAAAPAPRFVGRSEIQEITVAGEWAYLWTHLTVEVTPPGGNPVTRRGPTLSVLRKCDGRWLLHRDANLLAVVPPETKTGI